MSTQTSKSIVPIYDGMNKIPGGAMVIPLILGSIIGTFFPEFLNLGSFTTALFKSSAGPLIALLIFATGMQNYREKFWTCTCPYRCCITI